MIGIDRFEFFTDPARFPPDISPEFTPSVDSFMFGWCDESEVSEPVVLFVSVDVMKVVSFRDGSVLSFPEVDMLEDEMSVDCFPEIPGLGDGPSIWSLWFWSSFTHADSLTV